MKPRPSRPEHPVETPGRGADWAPRWEWLSLAAGLVVVALMTWWTGADAPAGDAVVLAPSASSAASGSVAGSAVMPPAGVGLSATAPEPRARDVPPTTLAAATLPPTTTAPVRIARERDPEGDLTPDLADHVNDGELPTMAEVISRLHQAGVHTGLGAFSPPGTRPPRVGLAVPEDFVLPEGYVRHYQATDDGQRIEPILMFAPGAQVLDAQQRPVPLPPDRVVPPELAPPGLPLRQVVVPSAGDTPPGG